MDCRAQSAEDAEALSELFANIDTTYFLPHDMTLDAARSIALLQGADVYLVGWDGEDAIAYGMLRGWDEGFDVPSLGVAVRNGYQRQGPGREMMLALHEAARSRGSKTVRLRVAPENTRARKLYDSIGYRTAGMERDEILMLFDLA